MVSVQVKAILLVKQKLLLNKKNGTRLNPFTNKKAYIQKDWDNEVPPQEYFDELCRVSKHQIIFGVEYVNLHAHPPKRTQQIPKI